MELKLRASLLAACLLAAGCGYIGDPLPPLANIPQAVMDVRAVQRGGNLIVQFTVPTRTTENIFLRTPLQLDLRIGVATPPFDRDTWAAAARRIPPAPISGGIARYTLPSSEWTGREVTIAVHAIGPTGRSSGWSNFESVMVVAPPPQPSGVRPEAAPEGVRLSWQGPAGEFRIFRRGGDQTAFTRAADTSEPSWTDTAAEFGKPYVYVVQRIVKLAGGREAESEISAEVSITPRDVFPPAAPANVRAAAGAASVDLAWDRGTEADLAGYRVYRAAPGAEFQKVADMVQLPAWSDRTVESGKTYRYVVTAIDQDGNESVKSAEVEVPVP